MATAMAMWSVPSSLTSFGSSSPEALARARSDLLVGLVKVRLSLCGVLSCTTASAADWTGRPSTKVGLGMDTHTPRVHER